ncbi:dethiobiotin synthase [Shewanella surugensis]|uniref:ATP-dependent dethiobiotin synthetase BioD n=1 Tax=Shewanella surugensis TaxID=212020 RepID=A0ABT0L7F7_9GAMM|nr:dethiobiotin synthase [Shewanella surugensis]MCL1123631.1 dethiobiotin synthase [Shewanella surugensis]
MYFVTGTDTDCGKTLVSSALLHQAKGRSLGFKPIASGCEMQAQGLRNADALSLLAASSVKLGDFLTLSNDGVSMALEYQHINPYAFEPAIAPHIAASQVSVDIEPELVLENIMFAKTLSLDFCIIEGAGGWHLPLGNHHFLSSVVKQAELAVILVVGVKLGCLNHALLTQEAILKAGIRIAGWVANCVDPDMPYVDDNLMTLLEVMSAPCLGIIPYLSVPKATVATKYLVLPQ